MKLSVRRIGNSLGVIIPRATLNDWGVGEGDFLELGARQIRPPSRPGNTEDKLDEHKHRLASEVVARFPLRLIRAHGLANLHRWKQQGTWGEAYGQWENLLEGASDGALFAAMLGRDDEAKRLRASPPYVGLLPREIVEKLNEEATG